MKDGNAWRWQEIQLTTADIDLAFIEFFDWRYSGIRDYQYARCRVLGSAEHPHLVGGDLLLGSLYVDFNSLDGLEADQA